MKYQVGEKVKYDSDDWRFFGTITAVIENAICPCYRVHVERMEKKNCNFSITQFEFELASDEMNSSQEKSSWKKYEDEFLKKNNKLQFAENKSNAFVQEPSELNQDVSGALQEPNDEMPSRKKYGSWQTNFELYCSGHKSKTINTWMYQNRRQYQSGTLKTDQLEQLKKANFPFEVTKKVATKKHTAKKGSKENVAADKKNDDTNDIWHKQLRQWKYNDNRASLQQWRQQNVKRYVEGKLSKDKIEKLKEAGILK